MIKTPFPNSRFADFPLVPPGGVTELPGHLDAGLGGDQGGHQTAALLTFLLWLEVAALHGSLPHHGLLSLLADQGALRHCAAPRRTDPGGPGGAERGGGELGVVPLRDGTFPHWH